MGDLPSRSERRLELAHRLNVMRIGGPTADGRSHLGGSMSMEDWIDLQEVLTADLVELPVKGSERYERAVAALRKWAGDNEDDSWTNLWSGGVDAVLAALREEE